MKRLLSAPASGIAYAVLTVTGILLVIGEQIDEKTDQEILSYYADSGNRTSEIVGLSFVTAGALFFLWFLSSLRSRLALFEAVPRTLSTLAFGAGVAASSLLIGAAAIAANSAVAAEVIGSKFVVDPNLVRFAFSAGYLFLMGSVLVSCVLIIATSILTMRTTVFPRWLGWVGFAAVAIAVVESFLFPVFAIPLWVLIVSAVMIFGTTDQPSARAGIDLTAPPRSKDRPPADREEHLADMN